LVVGRVEDSKRVDSIVEQTLLTCEEDAPSIKVVISSENIAVGVDGVGTRFTG
jgi:hypothetical protein